MSVKAAALPITGDQSFAMVINCGGHLGRPARTGDNSTDTEDEDMEL